LCAFRDSHGPVTSSFPLPGDPQETSRTGRYTCCLGLISGWSLWGRTSMSRLLRIVGCAGLLSAVVILGATFVVPLAAGASTQRGSPRPLDTNRGVCFRTHSV